MCQVPVKVGYIGDSFCFSTCAIFLVEFLFYGNIKDMKKNKSNTDNDLITKKYLDQRLEVTKKYLDGKLEVTKKYFDKKLDERLAKNTSKIIGYVDMRFKSVDEKLEKVDKKLEMLDSILKTLDWLARDYRDLTDAQTVQSEQIRRIDNRVTALEKRVLAS